MIVPVLAWYRSFSWENGERRMYSATARRPSVSCGADAHGVMEAEARVTPPEELANHRLVDPPLPEEHVEHAMPEEMLQRVEINLRERHEPTGGCEYAVGHQGVQMGMEIDQVAIGLDGDDDARDNPWVLTGGAEARLQGVGGTLTELPKEAAVLPEVHPEHFRNRENILAMGDGCQDLLGHPVPKLETPRLMAGRAEVSAFAREGEEVFVPTGITPDPGEALRKVATREELLHNVADGPFSAAY